MSRRITVTSKEIVEIDLAEEVVQELNQQSLTFNLEKMRFENRQYDDIRDTTIQKAMGIYYKKLKQRNIEKVTAALKKHNYHVNMTDDSNATKIVAVQRVYA